MAFNYYSGSYWGGPEYVTTSATTASWPFPLAYTNASSPVVARKLSDREWLDARLAAVIGA